MTMKKRRGEMAKRSPGKSSPKTKRVDFGLFAPEAQRVSVAGDFNGWDTDSLPMKRDQGGTWRTKISLAPGRYEYRFFVDGTWQEDPDTDERVANPFGDQNCVRIVI
jgi:1,4-alpha-glucan branching enzyme